MAKYLDATTNKIMELEGRIKKLESKPKVGFIFVILIVSAFEFGGYMESYLF